jgi:hypothetical protein
VRMLIVGDGFGMRSGRRLGEEIYPNQTDRLPRVHVSIGSASPFLDNCQVIS